MHIQPRELLLFQIVNFPNPIYSSWCEGQFSRRNVAHSQEDRFLQPIEAATGDPQAWFRRGKIIELTT